MRQPTGATEISRGHERGVSRRGLGRILCYYFLLAKGAIREISVRGTEIGETAWIIERSRLQ